MIVFTTQHRLPLAPSYSSAIELVHLPQPRRGAFLWDGPAWRWVLERHPVDVLHLPAWGVPPGIPVPVVATLHDVTPLRHPEAIPSPRVRRRAVQRLGTLRRATLVHAVSRATARDATRALGIHPSRVRVVPNGVTAPERVPEGVRRHVLYVGGADPHKRLGLLLEAWRGCPDGDLPPLVVVGTAGEHPSVREAVRRTPGRIVAAGTVDDAGLCRLYGEALAVLLPSLWEGFGLPALEGMAHGAIPVLTARSALPEAGGPGAVYLPVGAPPAAWAGAVLELVRDPERRAALRRRGRAHTARRSWEAAARGLVEVYREAVTLASSSRR